MLVEHKTKRPRWCGLEEERSLYVYIFYVIKVENMDSNRQKLNITNRFMTYAGILVKYQKTNNIRFLKVKFKTSFHLKFTQSFP